jgi:hypothetical protein
MNLYLIGVTVLDRGMESSGGDELERSRRAAPGQLYYGLAYLFVILLDIGLHALHIVLSKLDQKLYCRKSLGFYRFAQRTITAALADGRSRLL